MICNECTSRNPDGHKFCRDCGAKLTALSPDLAAAEAAREERERLGERVGGLLSAAHILAEQKRYEQAIPLAREASLILPDSTAAHSLLASLYERTDQDKKAIAALERVIELNPDSEADREKLDQLRRGVHVLPRSGAAVPPGPAGATTPRPKGPSWIPFVAAGATTAVVLGLGLSLVNNRNGSTTAADSTRVEHSTAEAAPAANGATAGTVAPTTTAGPVPPSQNEIQAAGTIGNAPPPNAQPKGVLPPASEVRSDPFASLGHGGKNTGVVAAPGAPNASRTAARPPYPAPSRATASLPLPFRDALRPAPNGGNSAAASAAERGGATLPPIIAVPPQSVRQNYDVPAVSAPPTRISAAPPTAPGLSDTPSRPPTGDGYIRITVGPSSGGGNSRGSGVSIPATAPTESALARARRFQSAGRFADAISAYQEALGSGAGSPGDVHQGIAECYHRMGNDASARAEYQAALSAYESQAASGRSVAAAQRGISACKAALEVLGG
jgi:tetratricopeptide (TPR) repeat protein